MDNRNWHAAASAEIDALEKQCATEAGRKAFYAGDGVARAKRIRSSLDALKARVEKFIRA
jgi:hypothetical protein